MNNIINNAHIESGRLKPDTAQNNPKVDRGVAVFNKIGKFFADYFGSGTVKVSVQGNKRCLSKGSCYKLLNVSKQNAPKSDEELIKAINAVFDKNQSSSIPKKNNLDDIFSDVQDRVDNVNAARDKLLAKLDALDEEDSKSPEEAYEEQKKKTQTAKELCRTYIKDNTVQAPSFLDGQKALNAERSGDPLYIPLKKDLEKNIVLKLQSFSNLYDSLENKKAAPTVIEIISISYDMKDFYSSRDEALKVLTQNCSPELSNAISAKLPASHFKSIIEILKENK